MKWIITIILILLIGSCVGIGTGVFPTLLDPSIEYNNDSMGSTAKIENSDYTLFVKTDGYVGDIALIGVIVPVIPIGQWEWLTGIREEDLRLTIMFNFIPKKANAKFEVGSVRVVVDEQIHVPTEVVMGEVLGAPALLKDQSALCPSSPYIQNTLPVDVSKEFAIDEPVCIWFKFANLLPPSKSFSVIGNGLPDIEYFLERKVEGELINPGP